VPDTTTTTGVGGEGDGRTPPTETTTTTTYSYPPCDPKNPPPVISIPMPTFYFPPVLIPAPTVPGLY
jgi:hypothetical protein